MAKSVATAYTGANVSLTIGSALVTNAFGISWEVSQNKRPIYGYNSLYYDGVADGQVIVLGQLYINFQHPQYLSYVLEKYYSELPRDFTTRGNDVFVDKKTQKLINLLRAYDNMGEHPGDAAMLDGLFSNPSLQSDMVANLSAGVITNATAPDGTTSLLANSGGLHGSLSERNLSEADKSSFASNERQPGVVSGGTASLHRPDQFSRAGGVNKPLNIIITYGNPNITSMGNGITSYMNSSTVILRDVHFIGEAQQIMSDDQPIMETYKFMARSKEVLVRSGNGITPYEQLRADEAAAAKAEAASPAEAAAGAEAKQANDASRANGTGSAKPVQPKNPAPDGTPAKIIAPDLPSAKPGTPMPPHP